MRIDPRDKPLLLALLAIAFAFLLNAGISFSEGPQQPTTEQSQHNSDAGGPTQQPVRISFWQRTVSDPINLFTAVLAILTVALVGTSVWQGSLTRQSINLGRAEFLASHRPRIRIRWISGPSSYGDEDDISVIKLCVANVGESPATIVEANIAASFVDNDGCFCASNVLDPREFVTNVVLQPSETHVFEQTHLGKNPVRLWDNVDEGDYFFLIDGAVAYVDGVGLKRVTSFARTLVQGSGAYRVFAAADYPSREYED
jgi:hypothetical protein